MTSYFDNNLPFHEFKDTISDVLEELIEILTEHAGPFAHNAIVGSKWRQINDVDEFTKDGIKILRHLIVSNHPVSRLIARLARFVGISVDSRCHDGTTTSMLMFARLARVTLDAVSDASSAREKYKIIKNIESILDELLTVIDDIKITEDDILERALSFGIDTTISDVRSSIAFHMAMISSKGDTELATKIAAVIKHSPKKIYGMFKDNLSPIETTDRYILEKQKYDISVKANIGNVQDYNYKNDTQFMVENAVIFSTANDVVTRSMESLFLNSFISRSPRHRNDLNYFGMTKGWEDYHEGVKNLIIITPLFNDPELLTSIIEFNNSNPTIKISVFSMQIPPTMRTAFNKTIHYMAGSHLFQDVITQDASLSLIGLNRSGIKVHLIGNVLAFSNLYDKSEDVFHPFYNDETAFEPYTEFRKEVEELIDFAMTNITNPVFDHDELTYMTSLYRTLTCQEIYDIIIGGPSHEQRANRTVYEDAIGAALSAIDDGVVLGGYNHIAKYLDSKSDATEDDSIRNVYLATADAVYDLLQDILRLSASDDIFIPDLISSQIRTKWDYIVADKNKFITYSNNDTYVTVETLDKDVMISFLSNSDTTTPVLTQAWSGYNEQFKRFRDILPKLGNSSSLIDMRINDADDVR